MVFFSKTNRGEQLCNNERSGRKRNTSVGHTRTRTYSKFKLYSHRGRNANKLKKENMNQEHN